MLLNIALLRSLCNLSTEIPPFAKTPLFTNLVLDLAIVLDTLEAHFESSRRSPANLRIQRIVSLRLGEMLNALPEISPVILDVVLHQSNTNAPRSFILLKGVIDQALRKICTRSTITNGDIAPKSSHYFEERKDEIMTFYSTHILSSKVAVPTYRSTAFSTLLDRYLDLPTLKDKLLPIIERMLLRSPEIALPILSSLISSNDLDISTILPGKILSAILSASKSSNAETRSKAVVAFRSLVNHRLSDGSILLAMITEVLALPKTGKTASAEHRVALYYMLGDVKPSDAISTYILDTSIPLVGKETNEAVLQIMKTTLSAHLGYIMTSTAILSASASNSLVKDLNSSRLPVRRALSELVGESLWSLPPSTSLSASGQAIAKILAPALDANLQTASNNLPTNPSGFLEGYVAIALALGPLANMDDAKSLTQSSFLTASYTTLTPKTSFFLNERVYSKLAPGSDVTWFQRCLETVIDRKRSHLSANVMRSVFLRNDATVLG